MRKLSILAAVVAVWAGFWAIGTNVSAQSQSNDNNIAIVDTCLPSDSGWAPTGGCLLKPHQGDTSFAEFNALLFSPLSVTTVGHPAWRNEPSYVSVKAGKNVRVTNLGGRNHTFTEVVQFGGGFVGPLNGVGVPGKVPLIPAAACVPPPGTVVVAPGDTIQVTGLAPGLHRFQCCIHPWMHAVIDVE